MKRRELIQQLGAAGCQLLRTGGKHDIYWNPANGRRQPVPRHTEINEHLSRHIKKHLGLKG